MNILLVEDSATIRVAMTAHIRAAGHECTVAENGEKAVQLVESEDIDMIIMDVEMPGLNGYETTLLIREQLDEHWVPIIFVTGNSADKDYHMGIEAGGDDYLIKPVSPVILAAKIKAMERLVNMRDQMNELNEQLRNLSQRDGLTGLFNRRYFDEKSAEAWRHAARHKEQLTVLLIDIDHFKRYNDRYGHLAGDECIKQVAQCMKNIANRSNDIVARYGGEEFVILLPETDFEGAEHLAEKLREAVENLNILHEGSAKYGRVTVSIGGACLRFTTGCQISMVIDAADKALYDSKENGRNCAHITEFNNLHKILMIESATDMSADVQELLTGHCHVSPLSSLKAIDAQLEKTLPELVILGLEDELDESIVIYKQLKEKLQQSQQNEKKLEHIPLILLSALNKDRLKRIGRSLGANDSLSQPLDPHQLIAKIDQFLLS